MKTKTVKYIVFYVCQETLKLKERLFNIADRQEAETFKNQVNGSLTTVKV
jgi:hypothetical protein